MRRILLTMAAVALAACHPPHEEAAPVAVPAAIASPDLAASAAAAHRAADSFLVLAGDFSHSGQVTRADNPAAKPLVDAVFDIRAVPTDPVQMDELAGVNDWLVSVAKVGRAYVLAGTGAARNDDPTGPAVEAQVNKNFAAYAPELGRYLDAQNALMSLEAASIARQLAADPAMGTRPGDAKQLAVMRAPLIKALDAMLVFLAQPSSSDDWRRARMPYLLALSAQAAKLNTPADLAPLRAHVAALAAASDDATMQADLGEMVRTLGG
jgi:hypothetical protein